MLNDIQAGIDSCLLVHGQSCSAKSSILFAPGGLIQRVAEGLFADDNKSEIRVSMIQVYNEEIHDLLGYDLPYTAVSNPPLEDKVDAMGDVLIPDMKMMAVDSTEALMK